MTGGPLDPEGDAAAIIRTLGLQPHPEGGHYRETWRDVPADGSRGAATSILFLLRGGERNRRHRVDADELWIWQAGAPLALSIAAERHLLGPRIDAGDALQLVVPRGQWQSAACLGAWTLVACVVTPAFSFEGFEIEKEEVLF